MEIQQVVVLAETGELQFTSLTRHVLYQTILVLFPEPGMHTVLPKSGSRKIENFCNELPKAILKKRRKPTSTDSPHFLPTIEIHKFLERAIDVTEFMLLIERRLLDLSEGEIHADTLHMICWNVYLMERQQDISIPQWFSTTCMYRLWLVFCCVQETTLSDTLLTTTANEVIRRLIELCGYMWNEAYSYSDTSTLTFQQYLKAIANYFSKLHLEMSLTCEVIVDMLDEVVHGVLKKGYLVKKGHKRKNYKRRWFILQRNIMKYFDTRENMAVKGQLVLNSRTEVKGIPDNRKRKCSFEVTCGKTLTPFEIYADDQRTKQQWMLAIKKAIALARVLDGSSKDDDYSEYLSGFYLLKYGVSQPALTRQDSSVRKMKYHANFKEQRTRLSGKRDSTKEVDVDCKKCSNDVGESPQDEYMEMNPLDDTLSSDSSEDGSYTSMSPIKEIRSTFSKSTDILDTTPGTTYTGMEPRRETIAGMEPVHVNGSGSLSHSVPRPSRSYTEKAKLPGNLEHPISLTEMEREEEGDSNVYDEAIVLPQYSLKTLDPQIGGYVDMDPQIGGYVDIAMINTTDNTSCSFNERVGLLSEADAESARKGDVDFLMARTMSLDLLGPNRHHQQQDTSPAHHNYLTIIRDTNEVASPPTVPVRVKSLTPERILDTSELNPLVHSGRSPPTPPPRSKNYPMKGEVRAVPSPQHIRGSSEPSLRHSTVAHSNIQGKRLPPLPPH